MRTRFALLAVMAVACGGRESAKKDVGSGSGSGSANAAAVEDPVRVGPHSGAIERVAVTDDGKVAYTIDTFGQARLWLSLDGTREPIIVRGGRAVHVALGRTNDGFVAALLDEAGGIELVRFDADGRTRGHVTLAPDPGFLEVLAIEGGMLARRRDEFLVWYDAGGHKRGQIAPEPGERISGLAVRRDRAIAAMVGAESKGITLRWIVFGKTIEWGTRQSIRAEVQAPIALSPDATKIAAVDAATKRFEIVDLTTGEGMYAKSSDSMIMSSGPSMGFLDSNTAVFSDVGGTTWWAIKANDPWATSQRGTPSDTSDVAFGDRMMLDSASTSLTLTTETSMKYLGYRDIGPAVLWPMQHGVAMQRGTKSVWLDRELRERVALDAPEAVVSAIVGDHHEVLSAAGKIFLEDMETHEQKTIGMYNEAAAAAFDAPSSVLVITTQARIERYRIGLSPLTVTPLPALVADKNGGQTTILDPAATGGLVAMIAVHELDGSLRLDWFREAATGKSDLKPMASTKVQNETMPVGADRRGVVYFVDRDENHLVIIQLGQPMRMLPLTTETVGTAEIHPDGTLVIVSTESELVAFDTATGEQRWKITLPGVDTLKFSVDGTLLFASASGGLSSIDPRTGTRIATACGWNFGLHDDQVSAQVFGVPNLCAGLE